MHTKVYAGKIDAQATDAQPVASALVESSLEGLADAPDEDVDHLEKGLPAFSPIAIPVANSARLLRERFEAQCRQIEQFHAGPAQTQPDRFPNEAFLRDYVQTCRGLQEPVDWAALRHAANQWRSGMMARAIENDAIDGPATRQLRALLHFVAKRDPIVAREQHRVAAVGAVGDGGSRLVETVRSGTLEDVKKAIADGVSLDARGGASCEPPLLLAALERAPFGSWRRDALVKLELLLDALLKYGADPHRPDESGLSPIDHCRDRLKLAGVAEEEAKHFLACVDQSHR